MAYRFQFFVDGSNMQGSLTHLNVSVKDFDGFFRLIFRKAVAQWRATFDAAQPPLAQLKRVYWYALSEVDNWDLTLPKVHTTLREHFDGDKEIRPLWLKEAGQALAAAGKSTEPKAVAEEAWQRCFQDFRPWYEQRKELVAGFNKFYHGVQLATEFIEIKKVGRWKVDFIHKSVEEKGLDTSLAVDMVGMAEAYDVAIVLSGDADTIPSMTFVKNLGRQVGVIEFLKGHPPEVKAKNVGHQIRVAADFVVPIYETELHTDGIVVPFHP